MVSFHQRYVSEAMVFHEQFRSARVLRRWTIERAAQELSIAPMYLQAIEEGRWSALPGGLYARQFVRRYAELLNLDRGEITALFDETASAAWESLERRQLDVPQIPRIAFSLWRFLRAVGGVAVIGIVGFYFWSVGSAMLEPTLLEIDLPQSELVITEPTFVIKGKSDAEAQLTVNGMALPLRPDGSFETSLVLLEGQNTIRLVAERKQRKQNVIERVVTVVSPQKN